jgi:hypothetical protein
MFNSKSILVILSLIIAIILYERCKGCFYVEKVYPEERMEIDPEFSAFFYSLIRSDSFSFINEIGERKLFVINNVDSIISNTKGSFINERPYKTLIMNFSQYGKDTVHLYRSNDAFVNIYPDNGINSLCIKFNNFYFIKDSVLPQTIEDTLLFNGQIISNYYLLKTSLNLKHRDDVEFLYISIPRGIFAFTTLSGEFWMREL